MSSSQAPDRSHPHECEWELLPLFLLSHETVNGFVGTHKKAAPSAMKSVISEAHPQGALSCPFGAIHLVSPEMTDFDLIPAAAAAGTLRGFLLGRFSDSLSAPGLLLRGALVYGNMPLC